MVDTEVQRVYINLEIKFFELNKRKLHVDLVNKL